MRQIQRILITLGLFGLLLPGCGPRQAEVTSPAVTAARAPSPVTVIYRSATPAPTASFTPAVTIAPSPTANDDPSYYYGGMLVTLDNVGQTITLKRRENFLLLLGESYTWSVDITPPEVISINAKITPNPGEQGVFIARAPGKAILRAIGNPTCRMTQPPCSRPSILFQIQVVVE